MFQSIKFIRSLGYDVATKSYSYEYDLTDSDFSCIVSGVALDGPGDWAAGGAVIQEYSKRNLNVAKNLLLYFQWSGKRYDWSIAEQIELVEKYQPLFTPQIKTELNKYLLLL